MTQEQKDLLLKDLCARLPYGVKIVIQDTFKYSIASREYHVLDVSNFSDIFCFNYKKFDKRIKKAMRERPNDIVIKPYLFPLSSMTEEQSKELEEIDPEFYSLICENGDICVSMDVRGYDWLNKYHFDYRGLIRMGLAIDCTNLNVY